MFMSLTANTRETYTGLYSEDPASLTMTLIVVSSNRELRQADQDTLIHLSTASTLSDPTSHHRHHEQPDRTLPQQHPVRARFPRAVRHPQ